MGDITPSGVSPTMLAQKPTEVKGSKRKTTIQKRKIKGKLEVLDKIDLSGSEEWSGAEKEGAYSRVCNYLWL